METIIVFCEQDEPDTTDYRLGCHLNMARLQDKFQQEHGSKNQWVRLKQAHELF